jgi:RnfABCDGE-type electron transport complex B subunit
MTEFLIAAAVMGGMGVLLAAVLAIADKKLYVWEDPHIEAVENLLPKANCGGCGFAGCHAFAEAVVGGKVAPGRCNVNSPQGTQAIAELLQIDAGQEEKRVARLACAGGAHVARQRANYAGIETCRAAALVSGGGKGCTWGCLGLADCMRACTFDAIHMNLHDLPEVDEFKCTACGDCVDICPKGLFSLHPVSHRLWLACRNLLDGPTAEAACEVACTACGRCAMDAAPGLIKITSNLAVIDYSKNHLASKAAIERCPTGAIVWFDEKQGITKGVQAKRITRVSALPVASAYELRSS